MGINTKFPKISTVFPSADETQILNNWMKELRANGIQVESHIRLFVYEFVKYVGEDLGFVVRRFAKNKVKEVNHWLDIEKEKALAIGKDSERANAEALAIIKSDLFKFISHLNDPDALPCLLSIISRCKEEDLQSYSELHLNNLKSTQFYSQLYSIDDKYKVDRLRSVLEPKHIIKWFKNKGSCEYDDLIKRVEMLYIPENQAKREIEAASCLFIRGLAHCSDVEKSTLEFGDWYYEFIEALLSHGDCRFFARLIDSNYIDSLDKWKAKKLVTAGLLKPQMLEHLIDDEEELTTPRDQINYLQHRITSIDSYAPEEYDLRPYQNELVLHANNGKNTIICAPTGSGKTLVAVDIIKNHLANRHREGKVGRCVMLVPTVPLVDQQALHFVQFLMDYKDNYRPKISYWVDGFSGCENIPDGRADRLLASDIVVMTPQILINMLESILRSERVYFADFTLMIFDECHHTVKLKFLNILMEMLESSNLIEKPQIVGLTASMGVGDTSLDIKACYEHMLTLCSNLHSDTISTVRHQLDNLKSHVMPPVDYVHRVKRPKEDLFLDYIERVMFQIEKDMKPYLPKLAELCKLKKEEIEFPLHSNTSRYQTIVGTLKKFAQRVQDSEMKFLLVRSIDHLSHYFHAILINDLLPSSYAFNYLQEKMKDYLNNSGGSTPIDLINKKLLNYYSAIHERLADCVKKENIQNKEILKELHSILRAQFNSDPNSRCLIFVSTRNSAAKLSDHLKNVPDLPLFYNKGNVGYMVSSNQSLSAGGQSTLEQQNMIKDFDSGKVKVLVVTSVAEEGVNIAACNLIIKYNNVGSERSMIQRRGRARQKNSVSILLALDTSIEQAEYVNMQKEAMMMKCLIDLQEKSETILKNQINAKREERRKIEERKLTVLEARRSRLNNRRYKLTCRSCNNLICKSIHVRSIAHTTFVVCDPTVWQRSKIDIREKPTKDHLFTKCAKWLCGQCGNQEWGVIVKYSNCYLPQLTANLFSLEREDQLDQLDEMRLGENRARTWNNIQEDYFNIIPINMRNIVDMFSALTTSFSKQIKDMDQQECIANLKYIEKMKEKKNDKKNKIQIYLEE
ncbi:hypothetical protein Mgra_00005866 [Meloidogyne graminicola]|uniref:RNA helicase n=1 Tax=Meloidogyne graminicola TaxID=189291 RepID=A0A8S9ZNG1_9BILA|nr:hypothetical protein Mgra_00005866 [Meloidogyne graminicola]